MTDTTHSERKFTLSNLAPWSAILIAAISVIFGFGVQSKRIDNLEERISAMQEENRGNAATLAEIKDTVTVVRTKLEILLPTTPMEPRR